VSWYHYRTYPTPESVLLGTKTTKSRGQRASLGSGIDLRGSICDFASRLRDLCVLNILGCSVCDGPVSSSAPIHDLLNHSNSPIRASRLGRKNLASLVYNEHTALGALRALQADSRDERLGRIADQRVGQVLLGLERCVGLGAIGGQSVDREAAGGQGLVGVAEEACLLGTCVTPRQRDAHSTRQGRTYIQAWKP
jgi:hypothetical protein